MIIKKNRKIAQEGAEQKVPNEVNQEVVSNSGEEEKDIDLFDLDNIDFKQRQERRRGDRRRGFRRIDDRNLISRAKEEANSIREAAAKEGKFIGSIAPFGYERIKLEHSKGYSLKIVPEDAKIIKMIFDWYVNGFTDANGETKRLGVQQIARKLNELLSH